MVNIGEIIMILGATTLIYGLSIASEEIWVTYGIITSMVGFIILMVLSAIEGYNPKK